MSARLLAMLSTSMLAAAALAAPAHAVTGGSPDGAQHPNVGTVVADYSAQSPGPDMACSGTLIDDAVFLTVAHCVAFIESQGLQPQVSFASIYDEGAASPAGLIGGTVVIHPLFGSGSSDPHDIAVILLGQTPGIAPAELPTAGLLDTRHANGTLHDQAFTLVGYGATRIDKTGGPHGLVFPDGVRRFVAQRFQSLQPNWLLLSSNASLGSGGSCFVDSGAPHFLGGTSSNTVASITGNLDPNCRAWDKTYRLDTETARDFLGQFVSLP
jgi:trypsin